LNYKKNIYILYAIVFLQAFVFYGPISTLYRQGRGITIFEVFLIESISWGVMLGLEIPFGWFADRFGYKRTLILANGVFFVSKIIFYNAYSFNMFLLERILLSISLAGLSGCDIALLHASDKSCDKGKLFSHYSALGTLGFLIASLATTWLIHSPLDAASIDRVGFFTIFPYGIAFGMTFLLKEVPHLETERPKLRKSIAKAIKNKELIGVVLAIALSREIYQGITVFLNQEQYLKSGIEVKWFGILLVLVQLVRLTAVKSHKLANRLGEKKALGILVLLMPIACFLLYFTSNPLLSVGGIILIAVAMAFIEPIAMSVENHSLENVDRATMLSVYGMMAEGVGAIVNPSIGIAAGNSLKAALLLCGAIGIVAFVIFRILSFKGGFFFNKKL